jgi:hypothetical protein
VWFRTHKDNFAFEPGHTHRFDGAPARVSRADDDISLIAHLIST